MPRTRAVNKAIRQQRKREILDTALKIFAVKGLAAAKISDIAGEAGLSHGLIYHYFNSKEEIFTQLIKEAVQYSNDAYRKASMLNGTPLEKLRALTEIFIQDGYSGRGVNYFFLISEASISDNVPVEARRILKEKSSLNREILLPLIIQGQKDGEIIKGEPEKLANAYQALIRGLALIYPEAFREQTFPDTEIVLNLFKC